MQKEMKKAARSTLDDLEKAFAAESMNFDVDARQDYISEELSGPIRNNTQQGAWHHCAHLPSFAHLSLQTPSRSRAWETLMIALMVGDVRDVMGMFQRSDT